MSIITATPDMCVKILEDRAKDKSRVSITDESGQSTHPLALYRSPPDEVIRENGFILNGILCDKLSFIGAYAGAGKTTAVAPLALIAAGLVDIPGINIYGWRRVVYISEHPEQLEAILKALIGHYSLDSATVWERIKVVEAVKMTAREVAKVSPDYRELSVTHKENNATAIFPPWVIIDTQSAVFRVENENDNAEMGEIVAVVKQQVDLPVSIIAHTAKAHKRGDPEMMSIRGGGALEGDANQVVYVSICPETNRRYIEIAVPKHRFVHTWDALELDFHIAEMPMSDPFGRKILSSVGYCTIAPVRNADRLETKQQAKKERERKAVADARGAVLARVVQCHEQAKLDPRDEENYPTQNKLAQSLKNARDDVRQATSELLAEGRIGVVTLPDFVKKKGPREYLVPAKPRGNSIAQIASTRPSESVD